MPTHQGKSQTDIVIGDQGDSSTGSATLELDYTTSGGADLQLEERSGISDQDATTEFKVLDAAGGALATVYTTFQASATMTGATELERARTDRYVPLPAGEAASWPTLPVTSVSRDWSVDVPGLGAQQASLEVVTTVASGVSVSQVIVEQTSSRLVVALTFTSGTTTVLDATVSFTTTQSTTGNVRPSTPIVDDQIWS